MRVKTYSRSGSQSNVAPMRTVKAGSELMRNSMSPLSKRKALGPVYGYSIWPERMKIAPYEPSTVKSVAVALPVIDTLKSDEPQTPRSLDDTSKKASSLVVIDVLSMVHPSLITAGLVPSNKRTLRSQSTIISVGTGVGLLVGADVIVGDGVSVGDEVGHADAVGAGVGGADE